ncbi:MAG TPA: FtsX-like permease family protein [Pseudomonadales bacterium]|nr:FtsX-like permease family protein [Pseudomonadales bacterium]
MTLSAITPSSWKMPLAWRMLVREWRGGELGLLFASLVLGVTLVTGISLFAERLQKALVGEASVYLGADRVLQVNDPVAQDWLNHAQQQGLSVARTTLFPTMVYPSGSDGERSALSALKAVSTSYPLRGDLGISDGTGQPEAVRHGPASGVAWVDNNILTQLDLGIGDRIDVGNSSFVVERVLTREGDAGSSFYGMGTRVMISDSDLPATGLIIPGSRVEYRYLFAGGETALDNFFDWLEPQLPKGSRVITLHDNQPGIAGALDKAGLFLRLAGSLGVLLAALAAAFAAQRYCERHTDTIAVLKTLGAGRPQVLGLLAGQMTGLWLLATLTGFLLGALLQQAFLGAMADWVPVAALPPAGAYPFVIGAATSLLCLLTLVLPAFWHLLAVPPWRVLRSDSTGVLAYSRSLWLALPGTGALLLLYSHDWKLTGLLLGGGLALVLLPAALFGWSLLIGGRALSMQAGSVWRLGIANVLRRRWLSLLQIVVFAICFMLLAVMVLLRGSLLNEWKLQIPPDAPNVFLINIAPDEVSKLQGELQNIHLQTAGLYPMVRGRLTEINGQQATELFGESVGEVYRELNLSWSITLPPDNVIVQGDWPGVSRANVPPVSIEQGLAKRLHLQLGDKLLFTIGDARLTTYIASIRSLNWDKMTPNFYFLFPPDTLETYSATWMTSLHRNAQQEAVLSRVLRHYPSVSAYPVDDLIARIQTIVERASLAVEVILLLVLIAGLLVLLTCLRASIDERLHESALLRTLGAGKQLILGSLAVEFIFIGLTAGILAACGAELTAWALQTHLFKMDFVAHPLLWIFVPTISTLMIVSAGTVFCYRAVIVPPITILRESNRQN